MSGKEWNGKQCPHPWRSIMLFKRLVFVAMLVGVVGSASAFDIVNRQLNGNGLVVYVPPNGVGLDVDKEFNTLNPIVLELEVTAADAGNIRELMEICSNFSGENWTDFHMEIVPLGPAFPTFLQSVPGNPWSDINGNPLANMTFVNPLNIDVFWNVPNGGAAATGYFTNTAGRLAIDCRNSQVGDRFLLVEYPTVPEPASLAAMGFGALAVLIRRRRK